MFVVDASALVKLFLDDEGHVEFRRWFAEVDGDGVPLAAPHLLLYEVGQVIRRAYPELTDDERALLLTAATASVRLENGATADAFAATRGGLSFYDASYLAVARATDSTLVTSDLALARAARLHGIAAQVF